MQRVGGGKVAVKVVHVSDLSGKQADENDMGKLVVHEHSNYRTPITLEVLPDEISELPESDTYVRVEYIPPGETSGQHAGLRHSLAQRPARRRSRRRGNR
jgi:hypothetical protein